MKMKRKPLLTALAFLFFYPTFSVAATPASDPLPELFHPRAMALGGAVSSIPDPIMSVRANPAGIAASRGLYGAVTYITRNKDQFDAVSVSVVDNSSSKFAGALQYTRLASDQETEDVGLTFAAGLGGYYFGTTVRYVHGKNAVIDDWDGEFVGDIGMMLFRDSGIGIGIVGKDLFANTIKTLEQRATLGVSYSGLTDFIFAGDFTRYFEDDYKDGNGGSLGIEWAPSQTGLALRIGQMWDGRTDEDYPSVGFGWDNQKFEIEYAYRITRQHTHQEIHSISLSGTF